MKLSLEMFIAWRGRGCLLARTILASTVQGGRCPLLSDVPRGARESEASVLLKAGQSSTLAQQDMKCWGNIRAVITFNLQTQQWLLPDWNNGTERKKPLLRQLLKQTNKQKLQEVKVLLFLSIKYLASWATSCLKPFQHLVPCATGQGSSAAPESWS